MAQITAGISVEYIPDNAIPWEPTAALATIDDLTFDWVVIPNVVEIPEVGGTPDSLESTDLSNTTYKTFVAGLLDVGGVIALKVNDSKTFRDAVEDMETALGLGKVWFRFKLPAPVGKSMIFEGDSVELGFGGAGINSLLANTLSLVPKSEPVWLANETV